MDDRIRYIYDIWIMCHFNSLSTNLIRFLHLHPFCIYVLLSFKCCGVPATCFVLQLLQLFHRFPWFLKKCLIVWLKLCCCGWATQRVYHSGIWLIIQLLCSPGLLCWAMIQGTFFVDQKKIDSVTRVQNTVLAIMYYADCLNAQEEVDD